MVSGNTFLMSLAAYSLTGTLTVLCCMGFYALTGQCGAPVPAQRG